MRNATLMSGVFYTVWYVIGKSAKEAFAHGGKSEIMDCGQPSSTTS